MATTNKYQINGVVKTSEDVLTNLNTLATASGCFLTWDPTTGQWNVIVNELGTTVKQFDDSNIIGAINISGSGVNELYNKASIQFPNKDIRETVDFVDLEIASADRYPGEIDNTLNLKLDCINDPVQAQYIASRELKQSRVDKIIQFKSDFTANGIRAGDLIGITASAYDYTNKVFRVIEIEETDDDDGNLYFDITALEYDVEVYSTAGLTKEFRTNRTGIISKIENEEIAQSDDVDTGSQIARLLALNAAGSLFNSLFSSDEETGLITQELEFSDPSTQGLLSSMTAPTPTITADTNVCNQADNVTIAISFDCDVCFFDNPSMTYAYEITSGTMNETNFSIPLTGTATSSEGLNFTATLTDAEVLETFNIVIGGVSKTISVNPIPEQYIDNVTSTSSIITEGDSVSVTVNTFGYDDGDTLNYAITGTAADKVTSPALNGTVTLNSDTASISITTSDDSAYNTDESITVTFSPAPVDYCGLSSGEPEVTITVQNNAATGPITPDIPKPGDFECEYTQVPVVWCGRFDADTQYLKSMNVRAYAYLPVAPVGGIAVPTSVTVTNPGQASAAINISGTVNVEPSAIGAAGIHFDVITAFDPPPGGGDTLITGTVITLTGYTIG